MDLDIFHYFYISFYYLTIITLIVLSISALDDLILDCIYWVYWFYRKQKIKQYQALTYSKLCAKTELPIAIAVPCYDEAEIIENMLTHNCMEIDYENYVIFVGVYENDKKTLKAVKNFASINSKIQCVVNKVQGPTSKYQNLNTIYKGILEYENSNNIKFQTFVFHDAEDLIHPISLRMYNFLTERKDIIQLPRFPLDVNNNCITHWTYNDELSEINTKDMAVREVLGGLLPFTGVGAFARRVLDSLASENNGLIFPEESKENISYSKTLLEKFREYSHIFITKSIFQNQWRRKITGDKYYLKRTEVYISTKSLFPFDYKEAVKQKTKWVLDLFSQNKQSALLKSNFSKIYMQCHDKKILITYFFNLLAYILIVFWIIFNNLNLNDSRFLELKELFFENKSFNIILTFFIFTIINRLVQRIIAVFRVYDNMSSSVLSIPRYIYLNLINAHGVLRAIRIMLTPKKFRKINIIKTKNNFPDLTGVIYKNKLLGELLLEKNLLTKGQLIELLQKQQHDGQFLGKLAIEKHYIDNVQLEDLLSEQYHIAKIPYKNIKVLELSDLPISTSLYNWLIENDLFPIKYFNNKITIAIKDPSNRLLINDLNNKMKPLEVILYLIYNR